MAVMAIVQLFPREGEVEPAQSRHGDSCATFPPFVPQNPKPNPRVFGFVLTTPKRHDPKAIAVNLTCVGGRMSEPFPGHGLQIDYHMLPFPALSFYKLGWSL